MNVCFINLYRIEFEFEFHARILIIIINNLAVKNKDINKLLRRRRRVNLTR